MTDTPAPVDRHTLESFKVAVIGADLDALSALLQSHPQLLQAAEHDWSDDREHKHWLHLAVSKKHLKVIEFLLKQGMDVDELCFEETPLYFAISRDIHAPVPLLLQFGANPDHQLNGVRTIHHAAFMDSRNASLLELIAHGAKLAFPGEATDVLVQAGAFGAVRNVKTLLQAGVDPGPALKQLKGPNSAAARELIEIWVQAERARKAVMNTSQSDLTSGLRSL